LGPPEAAVHKQATKAIANLELLVIESPSPTLRTRGPSASTLR